MKRLFPLPLLVLLALPALAHAQVDDTEYCQDPNATQTGDLRQYVIAKNRATCLRLNAGTNGVCTQAQACTAAGLSAGCTAAQARGTACSTTGAGCLVSARIWPDTQAGRNEFVQFVWVLREFTLAKAETPAHVQVDECVWWNNVATQTERDADCVKWGYLAGCPRCAP
jgi:hypothetical protein